MSLLKEEVIRLFFTVLDVKKSTKSKLDFTLNLT